MFRCTDCNTEYKIKPDYCDCGNNMFDEVPDQMPFRSYTTVPAGQIISIIIFIFCLILAAIPWTIPAHKSKPAASPAKREKQEANIPDIDKIWNDKTAKTDAKPITAQKTAAEPENLPASRILTPITQQPVKNNETAPKKQSQPEPQAKPQTSQQTPKQQQTVTPKKQTTAKTAPATQKPQRPVMSKTEFENYKNGIRLALLSKLDLVKITGAGECAVKFSLAQNGKLINRGFLYQSNNKSLNDQIYYMLMRLPVYKTPPAGYSGEVIKLKFHIDNGAYEISFID